MAAEQNNPDPELIRQTVAEVLQRPEFHVEQQTRGGESLLELLAQVLYWIITPFRWLFDALEGIPEAFRWIIVIGLFVVVVLLVIHIIYSLVVAIKPAVRKTNFQTSYSNRPISPEELEQLSLQAYNQQDYIGAIRFLFKASIADLQSLERRNFRRGLTNRGYLRWYRKTPLAVPLETFVDIIDKCWYGNSICKEEDYFNCRDAYVEIRNRQI